MACGGSIAAAVDAQQVMAIGEALAASFLQLLLIASDGIRKTNGGAL